MSANSSTTTTMVGRVFSSGASSSMLSRRYSGSVSGAPASSASFTLRLKPARLRTPMAAISL
ncbi:hypothetical protein D9M71_850870 [compost metagenome]